MNRDKAVEIAFSVGVKLSRDALWDAKRCNWFGPTNDIFLGHTLPCYGTLGPNIYDGTAGIALFLSHLYRASRDPVIQQTALGAIAHALSRVGDIPKRIDMSFYTGHAGIAYAAMQVGRLLERDDVLSMGKTLMLETLQADLSDKCILDVVLGLGGTIPAVLATASEFANGQLEETLLAWGDALIAAGQRSDKGISWDTTGEMKVNLADKSSSVAWMPTHEKHNAPHLLGYAHGTAGIAVALLELGVALGEPRYCEVAASAIDYENAWFDPVHQHWPDLRFYGQKNPQGQTHVAWCHGSAGIGLARIRAWELTQNVVYKDDALRAMRQTQQTLVTGLRPDVNFCLCHGIAGNAELFINNTIGAQLESEALLDRIMQFGATTYHEPKRPWSYGLENFQTPPGLMLGLAGTGYFYLRATDAAHTPSVLILRPPVC